MKRRHFWKPGERGPAPRSIDAERAEGGAADHDVLPHNSNDGMSLSQQRARLPIFKYRDHILHLVKKYSTVVVIGETGCGKTTQLPQYLLEAGWAVDGRVIAVLQPRRVAAITVAQRVAEEVGCRLGQQVGYAIRFDDKCSDVLTRVKFMTEGLLVREMMQDPLLSKYSVIMLDEAHERTLYLDIVVGLLYKIQKRRRDLRLIVSSATLDAETFRSFFNHNSTNNPEKDTSTILTLVGRTYPVDIHYSEEPIPNYVNSTVDAILGLHMSEGPGDILAFMTGQDEVDSVVDKVRSRAADLRGKRMGVLALPMYGGLPAADQMKVFERPPRATRKVVVATNIAEASVTIDGVVFVIDCGFVKQKSYNAVTGIESLTVTPVSRASADQRAGRAGRVQSGKCYRLCTEADFKKLRASNIPEMQRSNLSGVLLQLKALGIDNVLRFPFISPPPARNMMRALEILYAIGALDQAAKLCYPLGLQLAEFPLDPQTAKMLLQAGEFGCAEEMLSIAAMLQVQHVFVSPARAKLEAERNRMRFTAEEGDHLTYLNVYTAFVKHNCTPQWCGRHHINYKAMMRAVEIRRQLFKYLRRFGKHVQRSECSLDDIRRCVVSGFFANAARLGMDGSYRTIRGQHQLAIHPSSVLYTESRPKYVIYNEVVLTSQNYMRDILAVEPEWLSEMAPHFYVYEPQKREGKRARFDGDI